MTNLTSKPMKTSPEGSTTTIYERVSWICNTIFHQLVAVVGTFMLWTVCYNFETTKWHMVLLTIAYIPLMAEAIVLFASDNVWTQRIPRNIRYRIHGGMLFLSAVLATVGISLMINRKSAPHFQTVHGWTGLVSWIFVLLSQILGVASAQSQSLKSIARPVYFKFVHNLFGILGYLFGLTSLCYGLKKHTFTLTTSYESQVGSIVLIGLIAAWSLVAALKSAFGQLKAIVS